MASLQTDIRENLIEIENRIQTACAQAHRNRSDITLIGVTKTLPPETVRIAYDLGLRHFGENRFQESLSKIEELPADIVWHFIGTLQSNKAKRIAEKFAAIHTVSSESQLQEMAKYDGVIDALIEVNIAEEEQKSGILAERVDVLHECIVKCKSVRYRGLMTVGPFLRDSEQMRPFFRKMRELRDRVGGEWLSMGMSNDFEVAIQEGATHIRIGTALFGARTYN